MIMIACDCGMTHLCGEGVKRGMGGTRRGVSRGPGRGGRLVPEGGLTQASELGRGQILPPPSMKASGGLISGPRACVPKSLF